MADLSQENELITKALPQIREELGLVGIPGAAYSTLFALQLFANKVERRLDPDDVVREVRALQGLERSLTKPPAPFERAPLLGLWHKHYTSAQQLRINVALRWRAGPADLKRVINELLPVGEILTPDLIGRLAERIVSGGHQERASAGELTGHWIVYRPHAGVNYFLTLAAHGDDEATASRARDAARLEFPQLAIGG